MENASPAAGATGPRTRSAARQVGQSSGIVPPAPGPSVPSGSNPLPPPAQTRSAAPATVTPVPNAHVTAVNAPGPSRVTSDGAGPSSHRHAPVNLSHDDPASFLPGIPDLSASPEETQAIAKAVKQFKQTAKPELTWDGVHSATNDLRADLDVLLASLATTAALLGTPSTALAFILTQCLRDSALRKAQALVTTLGRMPTFKEVVDTLKEMIEDTVKSDNQLTDDIMNVKLLDMALKDGKAEPLLVCVNQLDELIRRRAQPLDPITLCYVYKKSLPKRLREKLGKDRVDGLPCEFTDPVRLRKAMLTLSDDFQDMVDNIKSKERSSSSAKRTRFSSPSANRQRPSNQSQNPSSSSPSRPSKPTKTFHTYEDGMSIWVENLSAEQRHKRRHDGLCLLCGSNTHLLAKCPQREELYNKGKYYCWWKQPRRSGTPHRSGQHKFNNRGKK